MCNICARCSKTMLVFWEILLSLSARRVWIEIYILFVIRLPGVMSLSARRVWIEISILTQRRKPPDVTLREEGVD